MIKLQWLPTVAKIQWYQIFNGMNKLSNALTRIKQKNKYYDVDIQNKTCTCPDFNFRQNKCKHIVATELYLF